MFTCDFHDCPTEHPAFELHSDLLAHYDVIHDFRHFKTVPDVPVDSVDVKLAALQARCDALEVQLAVVLENLPFVK